MYARRNLHALKRHPRLFLWISPRIHSAATRPISRTHLRISALKAQRLRCSRLLALESSALDPRWTPRKSISVTLSSLHHSIASLRRRTLQPNLAHEQIASPRIRSVMRLSALRDGIIRILSFNRSLHEVEVSRACARAVL